MNSFFSKSKYSTSINYFLQDDNSFYEVGYKVLQNQKNNDFIKCVKVIHNGKIKLVYNTMGLKSLLDFVNGITVDIFIKTIINLLQVLVDIKDNGFIECKNIDASPENIFIDINNLNISYIYIPIINEFRTEKDFIDEIKGNLLRLIQENRQLNGILINNLCFNLSSNKSVEEILRELSHTSEKVNICNTNHKEPKIEFIKEQPEVVKEKIKIKKGYINPIGNLFSKRNNVKEVDKYKSDFVEETSILIENKKNNISLIGVNTPVDVKFNIDRDKYLIGSSSQYSDGVITFNKAVSRKHCAILNEGMETYIMDVGSSNGTYLNGQRLSINVKESIKNGDIIRIANVEFRVIVE